MWLEDRGRYNINLENGETIAVKPVNIEIKHKAPPPNSPLLPRSTNQAPEPEQPPKKESTRECKEGVLDKGTIKIYTKTGEAVVVLKAHIEDDIKNPYYTIKVKITSLLS